MIQKINELKNFTLLEEENIKKEKTKGAIKEAKTAIYKTQKSVINNATKLYEKRTIIIDAFMNKNIYSGDVEKDVYYSSEEFEPEL